MVLVNIQRILVGFIFIFTGFLVISLMLIARLYQKKTGTATGYPHFVVILVLSLAAAVFYLCCDGPSVIKAVADVTISVMSLIGIFLGIKLYRKMTEVK